MEGSETSTTETSKTEVMESLSDAEFSLAVEVTYHGARQGFFEAAHRWMMFLTIVLGATAVTPIASEKVFAFFAAVVAATDIAFDLTGRAQKHGDLRRRYYDLVADVADQGAEKAEFTKRWMLISADEPPTKVWVDEIARWNTCIAMDREAGERPALWKRALAHFAPL